MHAPVAESPGTLIGRYKLLELIGEGGFGMVYMAEQETPVRRRVALKIIKLGMDTRQVIARFEAERQALAMMDHPHIAKVHDAGATETGRPYFVMELVQGVPITQYCDENRLTTIDRLMLFVDVCHAVQHAHQKGIIHRDIKPTNVMVTLIDRRSVPKVIDFGIAKATQQRLTEKTLYTSCRQFIGTPQYMSPEQAAMCEQDVDTRSDIYSLGVLLYELLVGTTPFDPEELHRCGYDKMCRMISETEPPSPSRRLSTLGDAISTVSEHRQVQPAVLTRQLRGDLDWIVTKALEKKPGDRYATAREFAEDVRRHLDNEPIQAKKPSLVDHVIKWTSRHRAAVWSAAVVLIVAVFLLSVSTFLIATAYQREVDQRTLAQIETERAIQSEMSARQSEARAKKSDQMARDVIDRIVTQTAERLRLMPHVQEIRRDMLEQALEFYNRFLEQRGNDPELQHDSALAWLRMGNIQSFMGQTDKAIASYGEAIRRLSELAGQNPSITSYQPELARSYLSLAERLTFPRRRHQYAINSADHAVRLYQELVKRYPTNREYCTQCARAWAVLGKNLKLSTRAEKAFRQSLDAWSQLPGGPPITPEELSGNAGAFLRYAGRLCATYRFGEAEKFMHEAIGLSERALAHPSANLFWQHSFLALVNDDLGKLLAHVGDFREAEHSYRNAIGAWKQLADQYLSIKGYAISPGMTWRDLSNILLATGRLPEAENALRRSIALCSRVAERQTYDREYEIELGTVHYRLGCLLHSTDRHEEAATEFVKSQQLLESYVDAFPDMASAPRRLVVLLATCPDHTFRRPERAVQLASRSVEAEPENGRWWHLLGVAQYYAGQYRDAVESLKKSMSLRNAGDSFDRLFLALAFWKLGDAQQAQHWYAEAADYIDNRGWRITRDFTPLDLERFRDEAKELEKTDAG